LVSFTPQPLYLWDQSEETKSRRWILEIAEISCKHGSEHLGSIKWEPLDELSD
jgi:hypothetical protein